MELFCLEGVVLALLGQRRQFRLSCLTQLLEQSLLVEDQVVVLLLLDAEAGHDLGMLVRLLDVLLVLLRDPLFQ